MTLPVGPGLPGPASRWKTLDDWRLAVGGRAKAPGGDPAGPLRPSAPDAPFSGVPGALDFEHIEEQAEGIFGGRKV